MIDIDVDEDEQSVSLQDAMTSMIDVIFVIIAFMMLMINVPLMTMEVELPKAVDKPAVANLNQNIISIGVFENDDTWLVNDTRVGSIRELKERLISDKHKYSGQLSVVIHSDRQVPMEKLVALFAALQELDLNVSHLALQQ
jgi:biopolymer transport protein ExbD